MSTFQIAQALAEKAALEVQLHHDDLLQARIDIIRHYIEEAFRKAAEIAEDFPVMEDNIPAMMSSECLGHRIARAIRSKIGEDVLDGPPCLRPHIQVDNVIGIESLRSSAAGESV